VPNSSVDVNSWEESACYPRSTFYPLSDGPSIQNHRITKAGFRPCSTCWSRSQAPFCLYTHCAISDRAEGTFALLRYSLGGDRPRYAIRAGRNLPDKEFRYLRTVIVTAAVYRGFDQRLRPPKGLTASLNLPAPGRRRTLYFLLRVSRVLCF